MAGLTNLSPTTDINTSPLAGAAMSMTYGPQTVQALRRSQYLADAIKQMQENGGKITGGYGELAAKLLATAILQRSNEKGQDALTKAMQADQSDESTKLLDLIKPRDDAPPVAQPQAAPQPQPGPQPGPQAAAQPPEPPPPPPPPDPNGPDFQPAVSPQDRDALTRMLAVEAGGEGPQGMAAAAHVALNRLKAGYGGAKSLSDVVYQPHQFEGMYKAGHVHPQDYAAAQAVADQVLGGQIPDPTGGAMAFLNPDLQQRLGRSIPKWAQGQGLRIGNHVFFGGQSPDAPPISAGADPFAPPHSAPVDGSPPAAGAPPAAVPPQAQAAGGNALGDWPMWKPSHQEYQYVQSLLLDPRTHAQGVAAARAMQQKMTQPEEASIQMINGMPFYVPKDPTAAARVRPIPVPPEAMTRHMDAAQAGAPGAPAGTSFDVKPTGDRSIAYQPPPGYAATGDGGLRAQPGGPADPTRPQPAPQGYQYQGGPQTQAAIPGGPADPKAPMNVMAGAQSLQKDLRPTIDLAVVARQSFGAVQTGYKQQNGAGDIAMVNGLQHLIDKGVVRGEDVNMQMKSNGLTGTLGSLSSYIQSNGLLTPEIRQKVLKTATDLFGNVDGQYRAQVMGNRQTFDNAYGPGAFDKFVMPGETTKALGWDSSPGAPAPPPPAAAPLPPPPAGSVDAGIIEAAKRGMQLTPAQRARARLYGVGR